MKIVFMGTPDFAVPTLLHLIEAGHQIAAVVTQPDKPKGRGKIVSFPPVKETALKYHIPVYQPKKVKDEEFVKVLETISPDVIVVAAFGQILSEQILNLPPYGCINVHASLLPKYRGAAPIQWAIINGETESGVTIMYMEKGLDTGDILKQTVIPIDSKETGGSLHDKLSEAGAFLLTEVLQELEDGTAKRTPQGEMTTPYAKMLEKEMGKLDFARTALELERLIRGLNPWPGTYTKLKGKTIKIWEAEIEQEQEEKNAILGEIVKLNKEEMVIKTGKGNLAIKELQLEGKKRMATEAFLRGNPVRIGDICISE